MRGVGGGGRVEQARGARAARGANEGEWSEWEGGEDGREVDAEGVCAQEEGAMGRRNGTARLGGTHEAARRCNGKVQ